MKHLLSDTCLASLTRFSLTIPSLAAKKAKTWERKCFSSGFNWSQCAKSLDKSTWKKHQHYTCLSYCMNCQFFFPLVADDTVFHLIMFLWRAAIQYLIPTSSTVQNEACACLYIFQMSGYWMGKMTNRLGFSRSKGSSSVSERFWQSGVLSLRPFYKEPEPRN